MTLSAPKFTKRAGGPTEDTAAPVAKKRSPLAIARFLILVTLLVGGLIAVATIGTDGVQDLLTDVGESRWGLVAFIAAYAISVVLLLPGTIGTLTAGAVFGFPYGVIGSLGGATLGATIAFVISRYMGREGAQSLFGSRLESFDDFIGRNDFVSILILRLMPIVPFNLLNYGSGLTSVRLSRYVPASLLGMAPATALATALGAEAGNPTGGKFIILLGLFLAVLVGSGVFAKRYQAAKMA